MVRAMMSRITASGDEAQPHQQLPAEDQNFFGRLLVRLAFVTEAVIRDIMARTIGQRASTCPKCWWMPKR